MNFNHLLAYYGTRKNMAEELGISYPTFLNRLKEPTSLLVYMNEFKKKTGLSADEILIMVNNMPSRSGEVSE